MFGSIVGNAQISNQQDMCRKAKQPSVELNRCYLHYTLPMTVIGYA